MTETPDPIWIIVPFLNNSAMTLATIGDCLLQSVATRVLLIDQGADQPTREAIDQYIDVRDDARVRCWHYLPALPSLSAVWNRALNFVWELGGDQALVVNNDVRLHRDTVQLLSGVIGHTKDTLFVSAVGVREAQFDPRMVASAGVEYSAPDAEGWGTILSKGGPDFSCFLLTREAHAKYPFDESFQPAYCEDLDTHRRYMLGGDGPRIFSVNLPFLHYASGTLKSYTPEQKQRFDRAYAGVVRRYTEVWGGPPNQERYTRKYDPTSEADGVSTPELQRRVQAGEPVEYPKLAGVYFGEA